MGVVDVDVVGAAGLAAAPVALDLAGPLPGGVLVAGLDDGVELEEVVLEAEGVGGGVVVDTVPDSVGGVAVVEDGGAGGQTGVGVDDALEGVEDLALGGDVVGLEHGGGGDAGVTVAADERVRAGLLDGGNLGVGDVANGLLLVGDAVEGGQQSLGLLGAAAVGESPSDDGLGLADVLVDDEVTDVDQHVDGGGAVVVESVELLEDALELLALPDVVVVVPVLGATGEDVHLDGGDDTKVVAGTLESPEQVGVAGGVDADGGTVTENEVDVEEVVRDQAVKTLEATVTTTETGSDDTDAVAGRGGGDIAALPKVVGDLAGEDTTAEPGGLAALGDLNAAELLDADHETSKVGQRAGEAVTTVVDEELDAVLVAVLDNGRDILLVGRDHNHLEVRLSIGVPARGGADVFGVVGAEDESALSALGTELGGDDIGIQDGIGHSKAAEVARDATSSGCRSREGDAAQEGSEVLHSWVWLMEMWRWRLCG